MPPSRRLQQYAIAISMVSIIYNGAEGGISIGLGAESSSRSLIFFGAQSAIEVASACMVLWRFEKVTPPGEESGLVLSPRDLRVEKIGSLTIGCLLCLLSISTIVTASVDLARHNSPTTSPASLIISSAALGIMILIWLPKRYLARTLDSSVMAGEAACSLSCIQITAALFVGSLIYKVWHGGWWVDGATALVLALLFARQGWEMLRWARDPNFNGGCCRDCAPRAPTEMTAQYRDLCECCAEKPECREAGECRCSQSNPSCNGDEESMPHSNGCCKPLTADGVKCCSHKVLPGPKPCAPSCHNEAKSREQQSCCGSQSCEIQLQPSETTKDCCSTTVSETIVSKACC